MATIDKQIAASSDDAEELAVSPYMDLTADELSLHSSGSKGGLRFIDVNIPSGATIDVAYIEIYLNDDSDDFFDGKTQYCENANNPPTFALIQNNISDRTWTTASVALGSGGQGTGWKTLPSIVACVQEVVDDQSGTGNALVIIIGNTTSDDLDWRTYDYNDHSLGAKLHIEYTVAGWTGKISGVTNPAKIMGVAVANIKSVKGVE